MSIVYSVPSNSFDILELDSYRDLLPVRLGLLDLLKHFSEFFEIVDIDPIPFAIRGTVKVISS